MSDVLVTKLKTIKEEIESLQNKYNSIINEVGYDLCLCNYCQGTGWYNKFVGNDCDGSHYETVQCPNCHGEKYILKEAKIKEG